MDDLSKTGRVCRSCQEYKGCDSFTPFKSGKNGLYPTCKSCRKPQSKAEWIQKPYVRKMYNRCKTRASARGIEFTIQLKDIVIPDVCPVFNVPMVGRYAPSLDRIDPSRGYVPGNVQVISTRANMLKNDAMAEELFTVAKFCEIIEIGRPLMDG